MKKLLELYQLEGCPYCQMVREKLAEKELSYIIHSVGRDRSKVKDISGQERVPVLVDPNTGKILEDEEKAIAYIEGL